MSSPKFFIFLLLITASIIIHVSIDPYEHARKQLLSHDNLTAGRSHWQVIGSGQVDRVGDAINLVNDKPGKHIVLSQLLPLPQQPRDFIITVEASSDRIKPGLKSDKSGRLVVVSLRGDARIPDYEIPSEVFRLVGTSEWHKYRMHIHAYPGVTALAVQVQLLDTTGRLSIRGLSLVPAVENPYWPVIRVIMLSLFVVYLLWLFYPMIKHRPLNWFIVGGLFTVVLIVLFTSMPMSLKNTIYSLFREIAPGLANILSLSGQPDERLLAEAPDVFVAKDSRFFSVMHFLFFMTAASLLFIGTARWKNGVQVFSDLAAVAVVTEAMQLFVMNRHGAIDNALVDVAGIVVGLGLAVLFETTSNALDPYRRE